MSRVKLWKLVALFGFVSTTLTVDAAYMPTNQDTKLPPPEVTTFITDTSEFTLLFETDTMAYYFRDDRDVLAIHDKRNGYLWKTGIDVPFDEATEDACDDILDTPGATVEQITNVCIPLEAGMSQTYEGIANSIMTLEYYTSVDSTSTTLLSSQDYEKSESELKQVIGSTNRYRLDINFDRANVYVKLYMTFDATGITYDIPFDEITGSGKPNMIALQLSPFLGATGGAKNYFDVNEMDYDKRTEYQNDIIPGYVMVPDGSGSLIRFKRNQSSLANYRGDVYGADMNQWWGYQSWESFYVDIKDPVMPVFGVAHGNRQSAFVAYAEQGGEYMSIVVSPNEARTTYTYAYPNFTYNTKFTQVYNQTGAGYSSLLAEPNNYDVTMRYDFLAGDGSTDGLPADYVGMAKKYREYLIDKGILTLKNDLPEMSIRLDFVMSDVMKSILGTQTVVTTTTEQVASILAGLQDEGVENITSGLIGYQNDGYSLGNLWNPQWNGEIGTRREFVDLFKQMAERDIDISLHTNYGVIYKEQMSLIGNASKHVNQWYSREIFFNADTLPMTESYNPRPEKVMSWLNSHLNNTRSLEPQSVTLEGIFNRLYSDYSDGYLSVTDVIELYDATLAAYKSTYGVKYDAVTPNQYLWQHVDRYLQTPMFTSQHLIETDAVPFLQLVLNGTMELYGPYVNFSFYTDADILRMIDYNVFPSFALTNDPSYELISTPLTRFYSTEYINYEVMIQDVYAQLDSIYSQLNGSAWIDRQVKSNGVIANYYESGAVVYINYTDESVSVDGHLIAPLHATVVGG